MNPWQHVMIKLNGCPSYWESWIWKTRLLAAVSPTKSSARHTTNCWKYLLRRIFENKKRFRKICQKSGLSTYICRTGSKEMSKMSISRPTACDFDVLSHTYLVRFRQMTSKIEKSVILQELQKGPMSSVTLGIILEGHR